MKNIYTVICYKIPNANNGTPEKDAGNLYFVIETFKTGINIKAEIQYIDCEYIHLCESKKQAEELKTFWEECEKKNRSERDAIKERERVTVRKYNIYKLGSPTRSVETSGSAYDVAEYIYKSELNSAPEYHAPRALRFNDGYKCTVSRIDHTEDGAQDITVVEAGK